MVFEEHKLQVMTSVSEDGIGNRRSRCDLISWSLSDIREPEVHNTSITGSANYSSWFGERPESGV